MSFGVSFGDGTSEVISAGILLNLFSIKMI